MAVKANSFYYELTSVHLNEVIQRPMTALFGCERPRFAAFLWTGLNYHHCWRLFSCPARRKSCSVVILDQRLTTWPGAKIVPALRVVSEKASLRVARLLFRTTTKTPGAFLSEAPKGWDTGMYLTNGSPRALNDAFSDHNSGGDAK